MNEAGDDEPDARRGFLSSSETDVWAGRCGCLAGFCVAVPVFFVGIIGLFMGDCPPDYPCHDNEGWRMLGVVAVVLALGVGALLGARRLAAAMGARRAELVFAFAIAVLLGLGVWLALSPDGLF